MIAIKLRLHAEENRETSAETEAYRLRNFLNIPYRKPDSAVSAFEVSLATFLKVCGSVPNLET